MTEHVYFLDAYSPFCLAIYWIGLTPLFETFLNSPVVYATDLSKAGGLGIALFCVALWFILLGASCFKVLPCSLSSCFFIPFTIMITSLGEEGAGLCASRAFVCLFCTC